ncbi:MAG: membrane protein insertase YidC [Candidatus Nanopelagicales bacterium]
MFIITWLETAVSWILVTFHALLSPMFGDASGITWGLSIVGLVIVIRVLLIPLFVKQIKAQRNLQILQPQMKEIQKKYAGDRQKQSEEMMKLYRETGTNPLSSCLPIIVQAPIFFALFRVLQGMSRGVAVGVLTPELVAQGREATIFGVPIYGTFMNASETPNPTATHVVTLAMIILMSLTTFITQRQLIVKNTAADNPIVRQQKLLLYIFPIMFAIGGINFPLGVLIYWLTTNLWSMGQQFWVIRNNPQPGTPAFEAKARRDAAKAAKKAGTVAAANTAAIEVAEEAKPVRNQPKKQSRKKRKG